MTTYDERARKLAKLPRAQRFEELLDFPTSFTFKVIGSGDSFVEDFRKALEAQGYDSMVPVERHSAKGRYVAISVTLKVTSGEQIDRTYSALEKLEGVAYIL